MPDDDIYRAVTEAEIELPQHGLAIIYEAMLSLPRGFRTGQTGNGSDQ